MYNLRHVFILVRLYWLTRGGDSIGRFQMAYGPYSLHSKHIIKLPKSHQKSTRNPTSNRPAGPCIWYVRRIGLSGCSLEFIRIRRVMAWVDAMGKNVWHVQHHHTYLLIFKYAIQNISRPGICVCACMMHRCIWLCIRIWVGRCVSGRDGEERWHVKH